MPASAHARGHSQLEGPASFLEEVRARIYDSNQDDLVVLDDLTALLERLTQLDPKAKERAQESAEAFLPAIARAMNDQGPLSPRELRDLRTVLRRLERGIDAIEGCMVLTAEASLDVAYRRLDVAKLVRHVMEAFRPLHTARDVRVELVTPNELRVEADARKLEVAVVCLVFEATKHATRGGWIRVELAEGGDDWTLGTADDGTPPDAANEKAILRRSGEIERGTVTWVNEVPIALGAVHDLVALHGGTTRLTDDERSRVVVTMPRRAPRGLPVGEENPLPTSLVQNAVEAAREQLNEEVRLEERALDRRGRPLVLIVEDSRAIQRVLVESLEPEFATISAFDGTGGLSLAMRERPDLIVLDLVLPAMDGNELVRKIRDAHDLDDVPLLVLTASSDEERLTRLLEGPVQDVVKKPFNRAEVRARIRNLLAEKRTRDLLNQTIGKHETDLVRLAEQVAAQQEALRKAHQAAQTANRVKRGFLRTMSHELRTPITAMEIQMTIFQRDPESIPNEAARVGLARLARSTRRLRWLIDTVMAWARIEGGRYEVAVSQIDLAELAQEVERDLREFADLKDVRIDCDVPVGSVIWSDRGLVRLVLLNLVSRAVQTTSRGEVCVRAVTNGDRAVIGVRDGAPHISRKREEHLFDPFKTADSQRWQTGSGSGLDLHIVWDIAHAVDGTVALKRDRKPGNLLVFTLPQLSRGRTTATFTRLGEGE